MGLLTRQTNIDWYLHTHFSETSSVNQARHAPTASLWPAVAHIWFKNQTNDRSDFLKTSQLSYTLLKNLLTIPLHELFTSGMVLTQKNEIKFAAECFIIAFMITLLEYQNLQSTYM